MPTSPRDASSSTGGSRPLPAPPLEGLHEAAVYVDDLDAADRFWRGLGLERVARKDGRHVFFRAGRDMLLCFDPDATARSDGEVPAHGAHGPGHVAMSVDGPDDLDAWRRRLGEAGVAVEAEVDWPNGRRSLYFRDPAGNSIELIERGAWDRS